MYAYNRYNKFKHVVAAALYAAILLTEAGEFFVSNYLNLHEVVNKSEISVEREIPEHIPEKYENGVLKALKAGKQKTTFTTGDNRLVGAVCFVVSILEDDSTGSSSEVNHNFIG